MTPKIIASQNWLPILILILLKTSACAEIKDASQEIRRESTILSGGHETDPRDCGRPVILIASALGVAPDVFREAFSHVRPAPAGQEPSPVQIQKNKSALLASLEKHKVNNEILDSVSNYYRYMPGKNNIWPNKPAVIKALVKDGVVIGYEIIDPGRGYTSAPMISVPNVKQPAYKIKLHFGAHLASNGSISAIAILPDRPNR